MEESVADEPPDFRGSTGLDEAFDEIPERFPVIHRCPTAGEDEGIEPLQCIQTIWETQREGSTLRHCTLVINLEVVDTVQSCTLS